MVCFVWYDISSSPWWYFLFIKPVQSTWLSRTRDWNFFTNHWLMFLPQQTHHIIINFYCIWLNILHNHYNNMATCQSVARKAKKKHSKWGICYRCGNQRKGTRGLNIHNQHSRMCLDSIFSVESNALLASPFVHPLLPHAERIRQSAPADVFNRSVETRSAVEDDHNICDDKFDFGSFSNDFEDNNVVQPASNCEEVPDQCMDNTDKVGDSNTTFPNITIMDAFVEHRKSGKAFDVSLFSEKEHVLIDLLHTLKNCVPHSKRTAKS